MGLNTDASESAPQVLHMLWPEHLPTIPQHEVDRVTGVFSAAGQHYL